MNKKITVLGAGMVGRAIIHDLSKDYIVTTVDVDDAALEYCKEHYNVITIKKNLQDTNTLGRIIEEADYVVSAVPGFMGYQTLETIISKGKNCVDISFMPEDFMQLNQLAKNNNVTAIADCGVAPGMPNIILGHYNNIMEIEKFEYMVGGLPMERKFPFEYKAPFSPIDVLEEYTRPARIMENGKIAAKTAMSEPELIYFEKLGHLEAFNTDGLRSILTTMPHIPYMKEKTLRYPGHINLIQALKTAGFFNEKPIKVNGKSVKPLDVTNQILINEWKQKPGEDEFTLMKIIIEGMSNQVPTRITYDLYDRYDKATSLSSMGRTTGFTATAAINLISKGIFNEHGVFPPEWVGAKDDSFQYIMDYLTKRKVDYRMKTEEM